MDENKKYMASINQLNKELLEAKKLIKALKFTIKNQDEDYKNLIQKIRCDDIWKTKEIMNK